MRLARDEYRIDGESGIPLLNQSDSAHALLESWCCLSSAWATVTDWCQNLMNNLPGEWLQEEVQAADYSACVVPLGHHLHISQQGVCDFIWEAKAMADSWDYGGLSEQDLLYRVELLRQTIVALHAQAASGLAEQAISYLPRVLSEFALNTQGTFEIRPCLLHALACGKGIIVTRGSLSGPFAAMQPLWLSLGPDFNRWLATPLQGRAFKAMRCQALCHFRHLSGG